MWSFRDRFHTLYFYTVQKCKQTNDCLEDRTKNLWENGPQRQSIKNVVKIGKLVWSIK